MITQEDIDAFETYHQDALEKKLKMQIFKVGYEFHYEYVYNMLMLMKYFGDRFTNEKLMEISFLAQQVYDEEQNT